MKLSCHICGNAENNRTHKAREMMFGTRAEFLYIECPQCGTLQIVEIPNDLAKFYPREYFSFEPAENVTLGETFGRRIAAHFAGRTLRGESSFLGRAVLRRKAWIADHFAPSLRPPFLRLSRDSRILDIGCGNGRLLQALHYLGFRNLTGADAFIDKDIKYKTGVQIFRRPTNRIEGEYDLVMLHHSFEHFADPAAALRDIRRLLSVDGRILIRMPVANFAWEKYGVNWVQLDPPRHLFIFAEQGFRQLVEANRMRVENVVYDSTALQFWGSEQYIRDIPLNDPRSQNVEPNVLFTPEQLTEWEREAERLNGDGLGDQACFYLRAA